tara:strand:- start:363 stop:587 length:225 start_codon:yes stop_codon:yes gene_type:complete
VENISFFFYFIFYFRSTGFRVVSFVSLVYLESMRGVYKGGKPKVTDTEKDTENKKDTEKGLVKSLSYLFIISGI